MGVHISGNKALKSSVHKALGARYNEPEWMLLIDYEFDAPQNYLQTIEREEEKIGRAILPSSYSMARFGEFLDENGNKTSLDGLVYQYSLARNPRNVHYAFRIFLDGDNISKNSGLRSLQEARSECESEAKKTIETQLFDLS